MKKLALLLVAAVLLSAVPLFAQDSFKDVPYDHWAYDAVAKLQDAGLVQGYPGDVFLGKRTLTRYEFAMVIANIYDALRSMIPTDSGGTAIVPEKVDTSGFLTKNDIDNILAAYTAKIDGLATKADVNAAVAQMGTDLKNLGAEFRKELDSLNVRTSDLDAKISDLAAMVAMIDAEQKRVKVTGTINTAAKVVNNINGQIVDRDNRWANPNDATIRSFGFFTDFDLNIKGKVSDKTSVTALLNMGNYLNYLDMVDTQNNGPISSFAGEGWGFFEDITPYYLYLETKTGLGNLTVGRIPVQLTPYSLKKVDVDSYVDNVKTDDGNYQIDGAKLVTNFGSVDFLGYFGKTNNNWYSESGLNSLFWTGGLLDWVVQEWDWKPITQTAGARLAINLPWDGKLGLNFTRNWSRDAWELYDGWWGASGMDYYDYPVRNQDEVAVADLELPLPWFDGVVISAVAGRTKQISKQDDDYYYDDWYNAYDAIPKLEVSHGVLDVKLAAPIGPVDLGVGWKRIGENFVAPGDWGKIGRWQNPRMIKGFYGDLGFDLGSNLKMNLGGEFYEFTDSRTSSWARLFKGDKIQKYVGGLEWRLSDSNSLGFDVEWVSYDWTRIGAFDGDKPTEKYLTLGWNHRLNDDAVLKIGYQLISYDRGYNVDNDNPLWPVPYYDDYNGGLGVVQLGVSF